MSDGNVISFFKSEYFKPLCTNVKEPVNEHLTYKFYKDENREYLCPHLTLEAAENIFKKQ